MAKSKHKRDSRPAISIVIPAYNEEKYLPKLLDSINAQDFKDFETIVAIKRSEDNTLSVARKYGCRIKLGGGLPSLSRNKGAEVAKADIVLFLDADTILPEGFLSQIFRNFKEKNYTCATVFFKPLSSNIVDKAAFLFYDLECLVMQRIKPITPGWCIMIRKDVFRKIKGFDTSLRIFEDFDLVERAGKHGKFGFMTNPKIWISTRRAQKEGRFAFYFKSVVEILLVCVIGKKRIQKVIPYEFGQF